MIQYACHIFKWQAFLFFRGYINHDPFGGAGDRFLLRNE